MNAMPAVKLRANDLPTPTRSIRKAKKATAKIIKLPVRKAKNRGLTTRQRENLVLEYRPKARKLARSILRKWHARLDLEEVDSIVDLSLCEAAQRFNPHKGAAFMTFFFYHLRGNLIRAVSTAANANTIPLPDSELEGKSFSSGEESCVSNALDVAEGLCGYDAVAPDDALLRKELIGLSQQACQKLDQLEREVISRVYLEEQQLMDIAVRLGYSRCHISRVKRKALETLFEELKANAKGEDWIRGPEILDEEDSRRPSRRAVQRRRPRASKQPYMTPERLAILHSAGA